MHTIKGTVNNIVQTTERGTIQITVADEKEKKISTTVAVQFNDPAEAAKYKIGQGVTVEIKANK